MVRPIDPALAATRRQQILDAAEACFRTQGFQQTNMAAICAAAALSPGAVYRYFPSKDALIGAIMEQHVAALRETSHGVGGFAALRNFARIILCADEGGQDLRLTAEVFAEARRRPEFLRHLAQTRAAVEKSLRDVIAEGQTSGDFRASIDPAFAAASLVCFLDGQIFQAITSEQDVMTADAINVFEKTAIAMLTDRPASNVAGDVQLQPCIGSKTAEAVL
ncbi:MAG: TetR/AcrR family transcriptional regulator [Caulobacterales bacterium]